jgi:hypothetical protein
MFKSICNTETTPVQFAEFKVFDLDSSKYKSWSEYQTAVDREQPHLQYYEIRNYNSNKMYLWKHGQAGIYDN